MEIKQAYKRKDGTYVVDDYHVCPKSVDPYGKYDIAEVEAYIIDHPEALIPEPVPPEPTEEELAARRVAEIIAELDRLDRATVRPLRAKETSRLTAIEAQAIALRLELQSLTPVEASE
jgi:hypothetical protein